jgi:hypothetical protein
VSNLPEEGLELLMDAMLHGPDGAVERQEAREQQRSVEPCLIGRDFGHGERAQKQRAALVAAGLQFTGEGDEVLERVVLPWGWKLVPTDHSMWSHLVDETGAKRAECFYKGAFYDRKAHVRVLARYRVEEESSEARDANGNRHGRFVVKDSRTGAVLFASEAGAIDWGESTQRMEDACVAYLDAHHPDWRDVGAYWGAP